MFAYSAPAGCTQAGCTPLFCGEPVPSTCTTAFLQLDAFSHLVCLYRDIPETHQRKTLTEGKRSFSPV